LLTWGIPALLLLLGHCSLRQEGAEALPPELLERVDAAYRNDEDPESRASMAPGLGYWAQVDTVSYVGMATCAVCHPKQHESYVRTGMGRSFAPATRERSDADFEGHPEVVDAERQLRYRPFWRGDALMVAEFRIQDGDTLHYREEQVDHIIGSGQHTNSHLIERDGYLYQAPVTFYTQEQRWDLAPGFEGGFSTRFERPIETECITCHNGNSIHRAGTRNAYEAIPAGIDCERCHGPGAQHVRQKLGGLLVDTSAHIDYSIVHPGKLALDRQLDLCQRCHLQGVAVLNDRSDWYDFRPGDRIREHWNVFLPDYGSLPGSSAAEGEGGSESAAFLMASQAERLRKSPCFVQTGGIGCTSCHNPHVSVKETARKTFNHACIGCHGGAEQPEGHCGLPLADRVIPEEAWESRVYAGGRLPEGAERSNDCSACHMPRSGAVDIPHVTITDHKVRIPRPEGGASDASTRFLGLECLTDSSPDALTRARAYLRFHEAFNRTAAMLDSAEAWLVRCDPKTDPRIDEDVLLRSRLHALWLREDFATAVALLADRDPGDWNDAWSCYRAGEAYVAMQVPQKAEAWFARSVALLPLDADMQTKHGNALAALGQTDAAMAAYTKALKLNPNKADAHSNLGFLLLQEGAAAAAEGHFRKACALDPDYLPARIHLIQWLAMHGRVAEAQTLLERNLQRHPQAPELLALQARLP
jgi:predicted CXXCH cytochrome family protein